MSPLRAIMVCVDYADILAVTLPRNTHHFGEVHIVTDSASVEAVSEVVVRSGLALGHPERKFFLWQTDLFYEDGATFNKWRALEWSLDQMGRRGWLCVMDADVVWPAEVQVNDFGESLRFDHPKGACLVNRGQLMTPLRRMWDNWPEQPIGLVNSLPVPDERLWNFFPRHRNVREWAGYSQVFHADDPVLGTPPWHEVDWKHAGGADSLFQRKWPAERKVRPPWDVLHLGPAGHNWLGRATTRADGSVPEGAEEKLKAIYDPITGLWARRHSIRRAGGSEAEAFRPERLGG